MTAVIVAFVAMGSVAGGILAGLGALYAGFASFGGVRPARVQRMLTTSLATASIAFLGSLVSRSDVATIVTVFLASFVLAIIGARSTSANIVAVQTVGVLIVLSGLPELASMPLANAGLVLAGGLFQTVFFAIAGPSFRHYEERKAVAEAYRTLAEFAQDLVNASPDRDEEDWSIPDAQPFQAARERLNETERFGAGPEVGLLRDVMNVAETMRAALVGFARSYAKERRSGLLERAWAESLAQRMAVAFGHAADAFQEANYAERILIRLEDDGEDLTPTRQELVRWVELLNRSFAEIAALNLDSYHRQEGKGSFFTDVRTSFTGLLDTKSLQRLTIGHAVRFSLVVGLATAYYRLFHVEHGYWLSLTIAIVLRADYATTLTRGLSRIAGTFLAVLVTTLVGLAIHLSPPVMLTVVLVAGWFSFAFFQASYLAYSFFLTVLVVYGLAAAGASEGHLGLARLIDTALGIAITLLTAWIWPIWQSANVRNVLRDAFEYQAKYADTLLQCLDGQPTEVADQIRHRGRALRIEAERVVQASFLEPRWTRKNLVGSAREYLGRLDENAARLLALHAQLVDHSEDRQYLAKQIQTSDLIAKNLAKELA